MSRAGNMTSEQFYHYYLDGRIVTTEDGIQTFSGGRVYIKVKDERYHEMVKMGILKEPPVRKCLNCDRDFESIQDMRICPTCKKDDSWSNFTGQTYYESI